MPGLSDDQKSMLRALLDDGEADEPEGDEPADEPEGDEPADEPEEEESDSDGGEMVVLRGARADSFLERFLGVTTPAPAKKAPAKKVAAKAPAKKVAAKKAAAPAADPAPSRPKFF